MITEINVMNSSSFDHRINAIFREIVRFPASRR